MHPFALCEQRHNSGELVYDGIEKSHACFNDLLYRWIQPFTVLLPSKVNWLPNLFIIISFSCSYSRFGPFSIKLELKAWADRPRLIHGLTVYLLVLQHEDKKERTSIAEPFVLSQNIQQDCLSLGLAPTIGKSNSTLNGSFAIYFRLLDLFIEVLSATRYYYFFSSLSALACSTPFVNNLWLIDHKQERRGTTVQSRYRYCSAYK